MTKKKQVKKNVIIGGIVIIAIIILLVTMIMKPDTVERDDSVAAMVNGQTVFTSEIIARLNQLPPEYRGDSDRGVLLNQSITEKLLEAEIEKEGVEVDEETLKDAFDNMLAQNQVSEEQFEEYIATNNMTKEEFMINFEKSLKLQQFVEEKLVADIEVSDEDLKEMYDANTESFAILEQRNVSHILICYTDAMRCDAERTQEEALELAKEVQSKITKTNFGELAVEYSDGPSGPTEGSLGYMDANTGFVPEFKEAALELEENSVTDIVETDFGYHLIKVYDIKEGQTLAFDDVKAGLKDQVLSQKRDEVVMEYIGDLISNADIERFMYANACEAEKVFYTDSYESKEGFLVVEKSDFDMVQLCFGDVEVGKYICDGKVKSSC